QIFTAGVGDATGTVVSNITVTTPGAGEFFGPAGGDANIRWSPDGMTLAVLADWPMGGTADDELALWLVPASGAPGGTRIVKGDAAGMMVQRVAWSADSSTIFILGDLIGGGVDELFATTDLATADQATAGIRIVQAPSSGDVAGLRMAQ